MGSESGKLVPVDGTGLRDLKKEATASALATAAFELANERGLDGFSIDDLAQRAGYSRRTFSNHFSCKEEAVASVVLFSARPTMEALASLEPPASLVDAVVLVYQTLSVERLLLIRKIAQLAEGAPSLKPYLISMQDALLSDGLDVIVQLAERLNYPPTAPYALIGAVRGVLFSISDGKLPVRMPGEPESSNPGLMSFEECMCMLFEHLRNGFDKPSID